MAFRSSIRALSALLLTSSLLVTSGSAVDLKYWREIVRFRPSAKIQKEIHARGEGWAVHRIEQAADDKVNLDYYAVEIDKMPTLEGKQLTPQELLKHVRLNFSSFMNNLAAEFETFTTDDQKLWHGESPAGAVLLIRIYLARNGVCALPTLPTWACPKDTTILDYGCVVVSEASASRFRFSTIKAGSGRLALNYRNKPGAHPVSGNREFGFSERANGGGYTFYSIGADRATRPMDVFWSLDSLKDQGYLAGDALWRSYQTKLVKFVNDHKGIARAREAETKRHDWTKIEKEFLVDPITPEWVKNPPKAED